LAGVGLAQVVPPAVPVLGIGEAPKDLSHFVIYLFLVMEQQKWI